MLSAPPAQERRFRFGAMLVEVLFIVLGVLLALGVNEWRAARQDTRLVQTALENVAEETVRNHKSVAWRLAYHERLRDSLMAHLRPRVLEQDHPFERLSLPQMGLTNGYGFQMLDHIAWETARSTGAVALMDYDEVLLLSRIYQMQGLLREVEQKITNTIHQAIEYAMDDDPERRFLSLLLLEPLFYEVPYLERQLLGAYEAAYAQLRPGDVLPAPDTTAGR